MSITLPSSLLILKSFFHPHYQKKELHRLRFPLSSRLIFDHSEQRLKIRLGETKALTCSMLFAAQTQVEVPCWCLQACVNDSEFNIATSQHFLCIFLPVRRESLKRLYLEMSRYTVSVQIYDPICWIQVHTCFCTIKKGIFGHFFFLLIQILIISQDLFGLQLV